MKILAFFLLLHGFFLAHAEAKRKPASDAVCDPAEFNEACYLEDNPDVRAKWKAPACSHWLQYGKKEGRKGLCTPPDFNEACYLSRYQDICTWSKQTHFSGYHHWKMSGMNEGRIAGCEPVITQPSDCTVVPSPAGESEISAPYPKSVTIRSDAVNGSPIELTIYPVELGGAVGSLRWNGTEFINRSDRGRELQSASSFDEHGECYNPPEAGTYSDKNTSSSKVLRLSAGPNSLSSESQPAFWLYGKRTGGGCKYGKQVDNPFSSHHFSKSIAMNYKGDPQVIEYKVTFSNPAGVPKTMAAYEVLTGYLTTDFQRLYAIHEGSLHEETNFNSLSGAGYPPGTTIAVPSDKFDPIVVSDANATHAMGVLVPTQTIQGNSDGFHFWRFPGPGGPNGGGSTKWNTAVFENVANQSSRSFRLLLVIGSVESVAAKLQTLINSEGSYRP